MKEKIGFISIGQAGGNIGRLFEEMGYDVLFINTSQEDLDTLKNTKFSYHIKGGEGCNKDRHKAKQLVVDDFDNIRKAIYEKITKPFIYVIFASSGGTGSGAGPMLIDLLLNDESTNRKSVGAMTIIPGESESVKAHINCYECFSELTAINDIASTLIIDNSKGDKLILNQHFVNLFCDFVDISSKHKSERGNIDKAEIEETLRTKGVLLISEIAAKESSTAALIGSFKKNIYAPVEADRVIKYITISTAGSIDIEELQKEIGIPVDVFQTYNDKSTICALSGLNYPQERLESVYSKTSDSQETIIRNLQAISQNRMKNDVNFLEHIKAAKEQVNEKAVSRNDVMKKYLKG